MAKQKSRAIPYRIYKKLFTDCPAYDYANGKITVDFPEDYLQSKMYIPEGWTKGSNYLARLMGRDPYGREVWATIIHCSDGGCKFYDATVTAGNTFMRGERTQKQYIRSFGAALDWAVQTAEKIIHPAQ